MAGLCYVSLSIYLLSINRFSAYAYEISLSRFYVHLMYIKVISVPELFKGIVTIVIIAFEPPIFPRSFPFVVAVVRVCCMIRFFLRWSDVV